MTVNQINNTDDLRMKVINFYYLRLMMQNGPSSLGRLAVLLPAHIQCDLLTAWYDER